MWHPGGWLAAAPCRQLTLGLAENKVLIFSDGSESCAILPGLPGLPGPPGLPGGLPGGMPLMMMPGCMFACRLLAFGLGGGRQLCRLSLDARILTGSLPGLGIEQSWHRSLTKVPGGTGAGGPPPAPGVFPGLMMPGAMPGCPGSTPGSLPPGLVFLNVRRGKRVRVQYSCGCRCFPVSGHKPVGCRVLSSKLW